MIKFSSTLWFFTFVFLNHFQNGESMLRCYLCADCNDPFSESYPYTSVVTNQNYGAACSKSVLTVPSGKIVSRGTTFNCIPASTTDIKVYCCQTDLCNGSNSLKQLTSLLLFSFFYSFYVLSN